MTISRWSKEKRAQSKVMGELNIAVRVIPTMMKSLLRGFLDNLITTNNEGRYTLTREGYAALQVINNY